jgi:hypothetical protein
LEVDEETGVAFVSAVYGPPAAIWSTEILEMALYTSSDGREHLRDKGQECGDLERLRLRHHLAEVCIHRGLPTVSALRVKAAVFEMPSDCGFVWFSIPSLWEELLLDMSPHSGAAWFQTRAVRWATLGHDLGLGEFAVRRSLPYSIDKDKQGDRVLCFVSLSLAMVLTICTRAAFAPSKRQGLYESSKANFERAVVGFMSYVPTDFVIPLRVDIDVAKALDQFMGRRPCVIRVVGGVVDCANFKLVADSDRILASGENGKDCQLIMEFHGKPFDLFFTALCCACAGRRSGLILSIYKQLLWATSVLIEKKVTSRSTTRTIRACKRELSRAYSDVDVEDVQVTKCWDARNPRHVERQLGCHQLAAQRMFEPEQFLSICGPDGSKVGTDLAINMAAVLGADCSKVALAFPQVWPPVSLL